MSAIIALVIFVLAAFGVKFGEVSLIPLGLAFMCLALLVGNWPIGVISRRE